MKAIWRQTRLLIRRLAGVATLVLLFAAPLESMIPDVHDGDDTVATAQASVTPQSDHNAPTSSHHGSRTDSHPFHLDHCAHSHLAAVPRSNVAEPGTLIVSRGVSGEPPGLHESIVLPPHQRPPIV